MIIFLLILLIIGGAAFAGWYFLLRESATDIADPTKTEGAANKDVKDQQPPPEPDFPDIVDLEQFVKIRMQEGQSINYITLKISIELIKPEMRQAFESNIDKIRQITESEVKKMS
ncbi:MAG: hypothetical protein HQK62_01775, partial [Desulfamplus sp.]|nr:hypothetical protein [Desulfamplus sp.]